MPIFVKDNKHFLFVHVPKTGGTSIETVFHRSGWTILYLDYGKEGSVNHLRLCSPQHMHKEMLEHQFSLDKFDEIFMLVRSPYDRFRSEYCWANKDNLHLSDTVEPWAKKSFDEFYENNYILDNHLRPQAEFHLPNANIYKLEDGLGNVYKDLSRRHNIELIDKDLNELAREDLSGFPSRKIELNKNVKEMINNIYSEDFKCFDYDIEQ